MTGTDTPGARTQSGGPTVALIGGPMTVEDGSRLDSRQPITGDPKCRIMRTTLAGSMLWWLTVVSLVEPLLRACGEDAFALVIGPRTVIQLQGDGSVRRIRLSTVIPGGISRVEIARSKFNMDGLFYEKLDPKYELAAELRAGFHRTGPSNGEIGLAYSKPRRRWRAAHGEDWYLPEAISALNPAVIVDTTDRILDDESFTVLAEERLLNEKTALILPHTQAAEAHIKAYGDAEGPQTWNPRVELEIRPWDPNARRDPMKYTTLVPIDASFGVTGLLQRYVWEDPSHLEAARALLQARFDLQIGIWDLVRNPVLRRTLLDATPAPVAPQHPGDIPAEAAERASQYAQRFTGNEQA